MKNTDKKQGISQGAKALVLVAKVAAVVREGAARAGGALGAGGGGRDARGRPRSAVRTAL